MQFPFEVYRIGRLTFVCAGMALVLHGCIGAPATVGPEKTKVSGQVNLDQKPLPDGQIVFIDATGELPRTYGAAVRGGKYEAELTPGAKRVEISARLPAPTATDPGANMKELLPARYNTESTLTAEISDEGEENLNFELTSTDAAGK